MTANADASLTWNSWEDIEWTTVEYQVRRLQIRIAKATQDGKHRKASALQWTLTHSYYAKLLAIKRVSQNRGSKTAGIDKIKWRKPTQKLAAVKQLKRVGYKPLPLRRIHIPKKNGKLRPLSIPTMRDRAMQALYLLALEPVSETIIDRHSYGFRPKRACIDAIEQCFNTLAFKSSSQWVLEGDIKACFDKISHTWLLQNIPIDKVILKKWLEAGFMENQQLQASLEGVPQGGVISPTLLNLTLRGLEKAIKAVTKPKQKVNLVVYADDFIITGITHEVLENVVKPVVIEFLQQRGLELSESKTSIIHISEGFNFLGFNIRKFRNKLLITPAKENVKGFLNKIRETTKNWATAKTENFINHLNPIIRGWANYYRNVVSKATFSKVDHYIFKAIWGWAKRRHKNKGSSWIYKKYFCTQGLNTWVFNAGYVRYKDRSKLLSLFKASSIPIKRHVKIISTANPFDNKYHEYFEKRAMRGAV